MKRIAVIFAGGVGARMNNSKTPKQFLEWNGRPILIQTLDVFEQTDSIDGIVLACKAEWIDHTKTSSKRLVYKNCIHCSRWRQCFRLSI